MTPSPCWLCIAPWFTLVRGDPWFERAKAIKGVSLAVEVEVWNSCGGYRDRDSTVAVVLYKFHTHKAQVISRQPRESKLFKDANVVPLQLVRL